MKCDICENEFTNTEKSILIQPNSDGKTRCFDCALKEFESEEHERKEKLEKEIITKFLKWVFNETEGRSIRIEDISDVYNIKIFEGKSEDLIQEYFDAIEIERIIRGRNGIE